MINFPEVPTFLDLGYFTTAPGLGSVAGPKGLSPQVVGMLHRAFKKAMEDPDLIWISRKMDMPLVYRNPQEPAKHLVEMNEEVGTSNLLRRRAWRYGQALLGQLIPV